MSYPTIPIGQHPLSVKLPRDLQNFRDDLDSQIQVLVQLLWAGGFETYESCQGGPGHSFPEPTIRFNGDPSTGYRLAGWMITHGVKFSDIRRRWWLQNGIELTGPEWEVTFLRRDVMHLNARFGREYPQCRCK